MNYRIGLIHLKMVAELVVSVQKTDKNTSSIRQEAEFGITEIRQLTNGKVWLYFINHYFL